MRNLRNILKITKYSIVVAICSFSILYPSASTANPYDDQYVFWRAVGIRAAVEALNNLGAVSSGYTSPDSYIVLTNAGYADVNGLGTMAALDGLSLIIPVSRGTNTLSEVHTGSRSPLWFAVFDRHSGYCAYLELNSDGIRNLKTAYEISTSLPTKIFKTMSTERIDANYLFATNPQNFAPNFGNSAFAIITIANAIAAGAPPYVIRSVEFHDHYCPGVASGIMMGNYAKAFFPPAPGESWFVQGTQPWCKEDALMIMLNATPGKKGYAVTYSTSTDRASWEYPNASSIIYHKNPSDTQWKGIVLSFTFPDGQTTGCAKYTNGTINKLCSDMWILERLNDENTISTLIKVERKFKLPANKHPADYAAPGIDVMKLIAGFDPM